MSAVMHCGCKLNLHLRILARREDGYHELDTLFYPLREPSDTLNVEVRPSGEGLRLTCSDPALEGPDNLVARAYAAFAEATGFAPALRARLDKAVPTGAGLGGGSADAAAMLLHLNALAGSLALSVSGLHALAAGLGADVPFFLGPTLAGPVPARASGIGEKLVPVDAEETNLAGLNMLLVLPDVAVPTARAYALWDKASEERLTGQGLEHRLTPLFSGMWLRNDFEGVVFQGYPQLRRLKERLLAMGAAAALMSGSGSALFGLFRERDAARAAGQKIEAEGGAVCRVVAV